MRTVQNITLFLSVLLLIGLVYFSFFNVYQTDDYIYSYGTKKLGFLGNVCDFYMHWGGRYFGYTINMLNPVSKDPFNILPKIYPVFLLTSFLTVIILNPFEFEYIILYICPSILIFSIYLVYHTKIKRYIKKANQLLKLVSLILILSIQVYYMLVPY